MSLDSAEAENELAGIADIIEDMFPGKGFTLMVYNHGEDDANVLYVSNSEPESVVQAMREVIEDHEQEAAPPLFSTRH